MMEKAGNALVLVAGGLITLAIVAVIVAKNAQTGTVLTSAGTAFSGIISAAVAPVSATNTTI